MLHNFQSRFKAVRHWLISQNNGIYTAIAHTKLSTKVINLCCVWIMKKPGVHMKVNNKVPKEMQNTKKQE
jgi:hypothetical protein